ncbi:MAG: TylF/MycF/NovP-related O-methyltransferase [Pseudomonadota bacterium]|nr:TylF/MycF/NovP-related O-methyltransferase [Pseudomonadota bacterium]
MLPVQINSLLNSYYADQRVEQALLPEVEPAKGKGCRSLSAVDALILLRDLKDHHDVAELIDFVRTCNSRFRAIRREMSYRNPNHANDHKDAQFSAGWAGAALLPVALALFAMNRSGISGGMLECGVFKGGSSACMSHVCDYLGIKLHAADSFEGLPHGSPNGYYEKGQFLGRYEEVRSNIERLGKPDSVSYIKGWFSDSLVGFSDPLALVFLDTDLFESSRDALNGAIGHLSPGGIIVSDGLSSRRDFVSGKLFPSSDESRAIFECLTSKSIPQKATTTGQDYLGMIVPRCAEDESLAYSAAFAKTLFSLIGNEGTTYPYYAYPSWSDEDAIAEMLADSAMAAVELRESVGDLREALNATEQLVADRDAALKKAEAMIQDRDRVIASHRASFKSGARRLMGRLLRR